ncbi:MAG: extracellular solute-binding protein, partial [Rhizobacter sp.]
MSESSTPKSPARRSLIKGAAAVTGAMAFPYVRAADPIVLRYLGTAVNQDKAIADKFKADTGITIQYIPVTTDDVTKRAVTAPNSFDLIDTEYFSLKKILPTGNLLGIDTKRIKNADKITTLFTKGEVAGKKVGDQGTSPKKVMYVASPTSKEFSATPTQFMTLIPTVYNADTLGIRPDLIKRPISSWAELLNPEFKGKAAILNIPSIGIMDAAMVVEATGKYKYPDKGNMTKAEIDLTIKTLIEAKKAGQFRALWKDFNESVNLMASGEVVIQSMWSPAVTAVRTKGIACTFQPLKEGYRGWGYTLGVMKHVSGLKLDCFNEYMNWYTGGFEGAFIARQGYYSAQPENTKKYLTEAEYDYWYGGKPAATDIMSPFGKLMEKAGNVR